MLFFKTETGISLLVFRSLTVTVVDPSFNPVKVTLLLAYTALTTDFSPDSTDTLPEAFETLIIAVAPTFMLILLGVT